MRRKEGNRFGPVCKPNWFGYGRAMLGLAANRATVPLRGMASTPRTNTLTEQQILGEALKRLRQHAGLSQAEAADKAGIVEITWRRYEKGVRGVTLDKLIELGQSIGFDRDALMRARTAVAGGQSAPPTPRAYQDRAAAFAHGASEPGLIIRDRVQAGSWFEADDTSQMAPRTYPAMRDARYPVADQWLSEVMGDSCNLLNIFEGDLVQLVDTITIGYHPRSGDVVEVERIRNGGAERELTIKQIEVVENGLLLWPRSSNPKWAQPLELRDGTDDGEDIEIRIRGLVVGLHRRF